MSLPTVLLTEGSDPAPLDWLKQQAHVLETPSSSPNFAAHLASADGLIVRTYTRVDAAFLAGAPRLKVVGRGGVGLENIDIPACRQRGIEVVFTPDANTRAVGDFVFGQILQLIRPWCFFKERAYEPEEFKRIREEVRGRQLDELTLGILGMGRIGRRVGRIATGFGMRILYNDLRDVAAELDFPAIPVEKETLYREADILTIHVDMRPGNHNLVGAPQLALMKPSSILVNTSRGQVLDATALAAALRQNRLYGAALDVFAPEPPAADFPLLGLDRVLLTPHLASRTGSAAENMSWVVRDVVTVLRGEKPTYPAPCSV
jgi:phosphoglycerate dehydrogenase-like enzyme